MASNEAVAKMFAVFGAIWPRDAERGNAITLNVYERCLTDIPDDLLQAAAVKVVSEATFWPKPSEIRAAALALVEPEDMSAGEAWALVQRYIRHCPPGRWWVAGKSYHAKPLPDRVRKCVDAIGGMAYLRLSENTMSDRARFATAYDTITRRERERARMLPEVRAVVERLAEQRVGQLEAGT